MPDMKVDDKIMDSVLVSGVSWKKIREFEDWSATAETLWISGDELFEDHDFTIIAVLSVKMRSELVRINPVQVIYQTSILDLGYSKSTRRRVFKRVCWKNEENHPLLNEQMIDLLDDFIEPYLTIVREGELFNRMKIPLPTARILGKISVVEKAIQWLAHLV